MDELDISGKRYISARRAAKENNYHSDYIGQLIRGGKVTGTKVGRAWYVEVESLAGYFGKELPTQEPISVATPVPPEPPHPAPAAMQEHTVTLTKIPTVTSHPLPLTSKRGLTYVPDDAPLYPEVRRKITTSRIVETPSIPRPHPTLPAESIETDEVGAWQTSAPSRTVLPMVLNIVAACIVCALALVASLQISAQITAGIGSPSITTYSFDKNIRLHF